MTTSQDRKNGSPATRSARWHRRAVVTAGLLLRGALLGVLLGCGLPGAGATEPPQGPDAAPSTSTASGEAAVQTDRRIDRPQPVEERRQQYLGRVLAEPMSHLGAAWLVRPERELEENATRAFQQLELKPGMRLCDLGCGNGYWTLPMARAVGDDGIVFAVDIQIEMLQQLRARLARARLNNVTPVLGDVDTPKLPADAALDLVLMVDVYHEFSHPESMLWAIRNALQPEGVVALLEYREEDPDVPIKPLHKMSKRQIMREYEANGFKLVREYNELPWQHLMFFARDDSPLSAIVPEPFVVD